MKTMKMILAGVLLMLPLLCQAQKNLFNKYGDMKGVSSVYISKAMIETCLLKMFILGKCPDS